MVRERSLKLGARDPRQQQIGDIRDAAREVVGKAHKIAVFSRDDGGSTLVRSLRRPSRARGCRRGDSNELGGGAHRHRDVEPGP